MKVVLNGVAKDGLGVDEEEQKHVEQHKEPIIDAEGLGTRSTERAIFRFIKGRICAPAPRARSAVQDRHVSHAIGTTCAPTEERNATVDVTLYSVSIHTLLTDLRHYCIYSQVTTPESA